MAKPTKPVPPAPALRSNPDAFRVNAEANILFLFTTLLDYVDSVADFTDEQADAALAAALGGTLPPIVGQALKFIRVNAGETAAEFISAPLATRVITGTANQIAVTNGDGIAGNPTLSAVFASQAEAEARVDTTKLVNVLRAAQTAAAVITSILASQAEAEAGTDNTKLMTPLRTAQAVKKLSPWTALALVNTTSGVAIDFTSIPSGVTDMEMWFNSVSIDTNDNFLIQIGNAGTPVTSGYESSSGDRGGETMSTTGFILRASASGGGNKIIGGVQLHHIGGNRWIEKHVLHRFMTSAPFFGAGAVSLTDALNFLRLTTVGGTAVFDLGQVKMRYR